MTSPKAGGRGLLAPTRISSTACARVPGGGRSADRLGPTPMGHPAAEVPSLTRVLRLEGDGLAGTDPGGDHYISRAHLRVTKSCTADPAAGKGPGLQEGGSTHADGMGGEGDRRPRTVLRAAGTQATLYLSAALAGT